MDALGLFIVREGSDRQLRRSASDTIAPFFPVADCELAAYQLKKSTVELLASDLDILTAGIQWQLIGIDRWIW